MSAGSSPLALGSAAIGTPSWVRLRATLQSSTTTLPGLAATFTERPWASFTVTGSVACAAAPEVDADEPFEVEELFEESDEPQAARPRASAAVSATVRVGRARATGTIKPSEVAVR